MAATREKRANAGSKMARLLEDEDEDEFYKTTYGGFEEEKDDGDFASEDSASDIVDSDFSIDEDDEVRSDLDDGEESSKRKKGIHTKAYKEPVKKKPKAGPSEPKPKKEKKPKPDRSAVQIYHSFTERKQLRHSTAQKSAQREKREKEMEHKKKMMKEIAAKKNVPEVRRLTQEELLEEAKETEALNIKSLETYHAMELEKKKNRVTKTAYRGPVIRYQSVTMPIMEEINDTDINVDEDAEGEPNPIRRMLRSTDSCSRTFITFTDEKFFNDCFKFAGKPRAPHKQYCAVTGAIAKYIDPVTLLPYANAQAFKVIRDAYQQQLTAENNKKQSTTDESRRRARLSQPDAIQVS